MFRLAGHWCCKNQGEVPKLHRLKNLSYPKGNGGMQGQLSPNQPALVRRNDDSVSQDLRTALFVQEPPTCLSSSSFLPVLLYQCHSVPPPTSPFHSSSSNLGVVSHGAYRRMPGSVSNGNDNDNDNGKTVALLNPAAFPTCPVLPSESPVTVGMLYQLSPIISIRLIRRQMHADLGPATSTLHFLPGKDPRP